MRKIQMYDETFEEVFDECMRYILNVSEKDERIALYDELIKTRGEYKTCYEDRNWGELVETNSFKRCIGYIDSVHVNTLYIMSN